MKKPKSKNYNGKKGSCVFPLLNNLHLTDPRPGKSVFPLVPDAKQFFGVLLMETLDVSRIGVLVLLDGDGVANDDVDGTAVGHQADVVIEDACGVT